MAIVVAFLGFTQGALTSIAGMLLFLFCAGLYGMATKRTILGIGFLVKMSVASGKTTKEAYQRITVASGVVLAITYYAQKFST
jgi:hypothetical protein